MDKRIIIASLASGTIGVLVGGTATYFVVKKKFAKQAQADIDDVKKAYHDKFDGKRVVTDYAVDVFEEPEESPEDLEAAQDARIAEAREFVDRLGYSKASDAEVEDVNQSIYDRTVAPPDDVEEVTDIRLIGYDWEALRNDHKPYLLSENEFYNTEAEWEKITITYYEDDDVLADENDKPIGDIDYLIGEQHLDFFGVMSNNKDVVYIRCPQISTDFEVTRNLGNYTQIVLGIEKNSEFVGTRRKYANEDEE